MSSLSQNCIAATTPQNAAPQISARSTRPTSSSERRHSEATKITPETPATCSGHRSAPVTWVVVIVARLMSA